MVSKIEWIGIGLFGSLVAFGWLYEPEPKDGRQVALKPFAGTLDYVDPFDPTKASGYIDPFDAPVETRTALRPFTGELDAPNVQQMDQIRAQQDQSWQARAAAREQEYQLRRQERQLDRIADAQEQHATAAKRAQRDAYYGSSLYDNDPSPPSRSEWDEEQASIAVVTRRAEPPPTYRGYDGRNMDRAIDVGNGYVKDRNTGIVRPTLDMGNGVRQEVRRPIDAMNDTRRDLDND